MIRHIFITGATGFLGWNLTKELLRDANNRLYLLVRGKNKQDPAARLASLLGRPCAKGLYSRAKKQIEVIEGDVTEENLGISASLAASLAKKIDTIYHCAALCEFNVPLGSIRRINVRGTKNVLDFGLECRRNGPLEIINYISTVAVAGDSGNRFYEDSLDIGQGFNNTYEQTKFEAEKLLDSYRREGLIISVFRPSIITGHSITGETDNFQMLYQPLHIFSLEIFSEIPADKTVKYNLVPVDYVARAIYLVSSGRANAGKTYHLVSPRGVTLDAILDTASGYFGFKRPRVVREGDVELKGFRKKVLEPYLPYLNHRKIVFDTANFKRGIRGSGFAWPRVDEKLLINLFRYCDKAGFIKRKK